MATSERRTEKVSIPSVGATLVGTAYWPAGEPKSSILINCAISVHQAFYVRFAEWVAEQGHLCLTYDYRDFGASSKVHPRQSEATISDWGVFDQQAALEALLQLADTPKVHVIGHSMGAFMMPLHQNLRKVDQVTAVACGHAYWRDHHLPYIFAVLAYWYLLGPVATRMKGYLPGKSMGLGADFPAGVYWQLRKWCTSPTFFKCDLGDTLPLMLEEPFTGPLRIMSLTDDDVAPTASVDRFASCFKGAQITRQLLHPADYGIGAVGHMSAFCKRNAALWPEILGASELKNAAA
ncbi:Alpha/beta hydrolase family protein [Pseudovibrio axinellae]|uniref:Alpha/beta hydrolase family protein n=1 Tax=Pseudovibrio axinellae TaxID=989403 RepID=A0A161VCW2_9HYPH|nr:alpha/beta fold hydrolase [Pseudovibrio axinellae]KZL22074.1 Alpha/beta hydrolase family protein [Pseudovibrio axinellae]SEQ56287.1 Predicted alpha/beta hydrolase [Pseudovibrio axinellae]